MKAEVQFLKMPGSIKCKNKDGKASKIKYMHKHTEKARQGEYEN